MFTRIKVLFDIAWIALVAYFVMQGLSSLNELNTILRTIAK